MTPSCSGPFSRPSRWASTSRRAWHSRGSFERSTWLSLSSWRRLSRRRGDELGDRVLVQADDLADLGVASIFELAKRENQPLSGGRAALAALTSSC